MFCCLRSLRTTSTLAASLAGRACIKPQEPLEKRAGESCHANPSQEACYILFQLPTLAIFCTMQACHSIMPIATPEPSHETTSCIYILRIPLGVIYFCCCCNCFLRKLPCYLKPHLAIHILQLPVCKLQSKHNGQTCAHKDAHT